MAKSDFVPGAARFGNFINYYEFNSPENRLAILPRDMLAKLGYDSSSTVVALDVGCNSGDMTIALHNFLTDSTNGNPRYRLHILGVDLDPVLITRAREKNVHDTITFATNDIMSNDDAHIFSDYLARNNKKNFDVVFCLSISMWIHLNCGDQGLRLFLRMLSDVTKYLIIEPQPWKCYKTAVRRASRLKQDKFDQFGVLKIRENVVDFIRSYLVNDCKMIFRECYGQTAWNRPIMIFENTGI